LHTEAQAAEFFLHLKGHDLRRTSLIGFSLELAAELIQQGIPAIIHHASPPHAAFAWTSMASSEDGRVAVVQGLLQFRAHGAS
jgi:hypothetical protein